MLEAITILILILMIFVFSKKIKAEQDKKLMWENRAITLISELKNETGRTYFFTDDICGIDSFVEEEKHDWNFSLPEENDKEEENGL